MENIIFALVICTEEPIQIRVNEDWQNIVDASIYHARMDSLSIEFETRKKNRFLIDGQSNIWFNLIME